MKTKPKTSVNNLFFLFFVSVLASLAVLTFLLLPIFERNKSKTEDKAREERKEGTEEELPEIMVQVEGFDFPDDFFHPLNFGETLRTEINASNQPNVFSSSGGYLNGYTFVLPELSDYRNIEVYFRSCPDDGTGEHYNNCRSEAAFLEWMRLYNSNWERLGGGDTRIDFDAFPITADRLYYLLVGSSNNGVGHYKITLDYESTLVNFKVKFRGIDKKAPDMRVKVKLYQIWMRDKLTDLGDKPVVSNDQGIYSGYFYLGNVDLDYGDYTLLIKGPRHLQRRYPDLDFVKGLEVDLTSKPLEPGDLALPQDGKVDQLDFNYLWEHRGKTDAGVLAIADLNSDGAINTGDINLLLETLSTRYDEEGW